MISCPMPQDIFKYKAKFIGNFTTRQLIWGGLGVAASIGSYLYILPEIDIYFNLNFSQELRLYISGFLGVPFLAMGFLKIYEQPLERILPQLITDNFITPAKRYKETSPFNYKKQKNIQKKSQEKLKKSNKYKEIK